MDNPFIGCHFRAEIILINSVIVIFAHYGRYDVRELLMMSLYPDPG